MKNSKLSLVMLLLLAGSSLQAGKGAAIGIGSGFGGFMLGRATAPRNETVIVRDGGSSSSRTERRLRRDIDDLRDEVDHLKDDNRELKNENRDMKRKLSRCENQLDKQNRSTKRQKTGKSKSWFGQVEEEIEDEF